MLSLTIASGWDAGDVIALGAVISSAIVALGTTILSGRNQRILAREERQADDKRDAYLRVADFASRTAQYARVAMPGVDDGHPLMPPPFSDDELWTMHAHVAAFASDDVRRTLEDVLGQRARVRNSAHHAEEMRQMTPPFDGEMIRARMDAVKTLSTRRDELLTSCQDLLSRLRSELAQKAKRSALDAARRVRPE